MPIYEYCCQDCERLFEIIVFNSSTRVVCPGCGGQRVERRPSAFGISGATRGSGTGTGCAGCKRSSCAGCG